MEALEEPPLRGRPPTSDGDTFPDVTEALDLSPHSRDHSDELAGANVFLQSLTWTRNPSCSGARGPLSTGSPRLRAGPGGAGRGRAEAPDLEVAGPGGIQSGFCGLGGPGRVAGGGGGAHSSRPGGRCRPERRGPAAGRMGRSAARGSGEAAAALEAAARGSLTPTPFPP